MKNRLFVALLLAAVLALPALAQSHSHHNARSTRGRSRRQRQACFAAGHA